MNLSILTLLQEANFKVSSVTDTATDDFDRDADRSPPFLSTLGSPQTWAQVAAAAQQSQTPVTHIGQISAERGLRLVDGDGQVVPNTFTSFDHFA